MDIVKYSVGPLQTNSYLAWDKQSKRGVIIDPGDEGDFLSEQVLKHKINLEKIILTHGHFDHVLGVLPLKLNFNPQICLHSADLFLYKHANSSSLHWIGEGGDPLPHPDIYLKDNDEIEMGNTALTVIHTPGHTPGSICLSSNKQKVLFTGDLLFESGVGRTDFSYSSTKDLQNSLSQINRGFINYRAYSGHGQDFVIS